MIRLFISEELFLNKVIELMDKHRHYLLNVMRQKAGNTLLVFNGKNGEWLADIEELNKKKGLIKLKEQNRFQTTDKKLVLCPALIKKENMDLVFQKATELGVTEIYPLITEHTVVSKLNMERVKTLVTEAAEQCERLSIPFIHEPQKLSNFLHHLDRDIIPVCLSERGGVSLSPKTISNAVFCIGPEGGWSQNELDLFQKKNTCFWHLGDTIMRAETASIVALGCVRFMTEA